jgi:dynein heavy chain 1
MASSSGKGAAPKVTSYLRSLAPVMMDLADAEVETLLTTPITMAKIDSFANDVVPVLVMTKAVSEEGEEEAAESDLEVSLEVSFTSQRRAGVVLIKKKPNVALDSERSVGSQIQLVNLADQSPFDTVHSFLHNSFAPYLRSFMVKEHGEKRLQGGLAVLDQKITEFELSLYNCKQDVQVENVILMIHPEVKEAAKRCKMEGSSLTPQALGPLLDDAKFLNKLQTGVVTWVRQIESVTKHERIKTFPEQSTFSQEINFWLELERVTHSIQQARESDEVVCTLAILEQAKRYFATVAFKSDSFGLKNALKEVENAKTIMRNFPVDQLLTAKDLKSILAAIEEIFGHLKKKYSEKYPIPRLLALIRAIASDVSGKIVTILSAKRLMALTFDDFIVIVSLCDDLFTSWEKHREGLLRKYTQVNNCSGLFRPLQRRLQDVQKFRKHHEQLYRVIVRVLHENKDEDSEDSLEINPIQEITDAYLPMKQVDVLDLTEPGTADWEAALDVYETCIDRVETQITLKLRDKLGAAKNATEMFRVCSKFNALFFRPRIRSAVQEYQNELLRR